MLYIALLVFLLIFITEYYKLSLYVGRSDIHGSGLFTILPIKKGEVILDDILLIKLEI